MLQADGGSLRTQFGGFCEKGKTLPGVMGLSGGLIRKLE
jgi:hypothetical protein